MSGPAEPSGMLSYCVKTLRDDDLPASIAAENKPTIRCGCRLWKLTKIDHVDGSFYCRLGLLFEWADPDNIGKAKSEVVGPRWDAPKDVLGSQGFCPLPRFENVKDYVTDLDQSLQPIVQDPQSGRTSLSLVISGTFWREMSLEDFPLDIQLLEVKIRFPHAKDRTRIERLPMDGTGNACIMDEGMFCPVLGVYMSSETRSGAPQISCCLNTT